MALRLVSREPGKPACLIAYVTDSRGRGMRRAIAPTKIRDELG